MSENGLIMLTGSGLAPADVVKVARRQAKIELGPGVDRRLRVERAVVESALGTDEPVYGLTTGLGARSVHRLPVEELAQFSARTVRGRATAVGARLGDEAVRAVMVARVNAMARGGSGVQPSIVHLLVDMLNLGVHPQIPGTGSIGASDLCQLAHVGLVVMGEGTASFEGRGGSGSEALGWAGLAPVTLGPKDGLALCSANAVSAGVAALALAAVDDLHWLLHAVVATSFEGFRANTTPLRPKVLAARPAPGQAASAALLCRLLSGGLLLDAGAGRRLQDPFSFRCAAQVHGTLRIASEFALPAVAAELNGAADNPLVLMSGDEPAARTPSDGAAGELISNGNFHTPALALALDTLALALAQSAALSLARAQRLMSARLSGLPANLGREGPGSSGFAAVVKTGQALLAEIRHLAAPTSIDPRSGAEDVEDDSTNAVLGAQRVTGIVERLRLVVAIEALVATQALELAGPERVGIGPAHVVGAVRARVPALDEDRPCGRDIETVAADVLTPELAAQLAALAV
jgi:histidine ammonia-lyase